MRPQREFTRGFETPVLSISPKTPMFSIEQPEIRLPMHEQIHMPVQNAASDRIVYPEQPSQALTASIEQRRANLTDTPLVDEQRVPAPARDAYLKTSQLRTSSDKEVFL